MLGYNDEWNRSIQQNFSIDQTQGASVDIHGNNNKVNIEQGQQSTSSGGGSDGSGGSVNPECKAFCSNIGS